MRRGARVRAKRRIKRLITRLKLGGDDKWSRGWYGGLRRIQVAPNSRTELSCTEVVKAA